MVNDFQTEVRQFDFYILLFLSFEWCVPQNVIKETHAAVIDNNLNELINITSPPVPKGLLASKDVNGLTPLHKAAGLNYLAIVDYILRTNPATATELDATGKSPLHWASSLEIYNKLVQAGADELACDYVCHTAALHLALTILIMILSFFPWKIKINSE